MKARRFKETPRDSASSLHKVVFSLLKEMFPTAVIYQEYPYDKILKSSYNLYSVPENAYNSYYLSYGKRLRADFYIKTYRSIIEIQGKQHYEPIRWSKGADSWEKAVIRFNAQKRIDHIKKDIANEANCRYIEIDYKNTDKEAVKEIIWREIEK